MGIKKRIGDFVKKHRFISILIALALIGLLIFIGFKIYLYVQFVLGNDLIMKLDSSANDVSLLNGQNKTIQFSITAITGPLCQVKCQSYFEDLSAGQVMESDNFSIGRTTLSKNEMVFSGKGVGQKLYLFRIACNNVKSLFCNTDEEKFTRESLVSVEYSLNDFQKSLKENLSNRIINLEKNNNKLNLIENYLSNESEELNKYFYFNYSAQNITSLNIEGVVGLFENYDFEEANKSLTLIESDFNNANNIMIQALDYFEKNVSFYNNLVSNISGVRNRIETLKSAIDSNQSDDLIARINDFNNKISLFGSSNSLQKKKNITDSILAIDLSDFNTGLTSLNNSLIFNLSPINFSLPSFENISFNFSVAEPAKICCANSNCGGCGRNSSSNYPIIFIHGHDFNGGVSAEYSLNAFTEIQENLSLDYLNAGEITMYSPARSSPGLLGMINLPVSFKITYYFDAFQNGSSYLPVQAKAENIDTYALRLKSLVDSAKYETGKDKVIIITHSMGGLVARRYVQIFGNGSVDKMILIGSPNHGVTGSIQSFCNVVGSDRECVDLSADSLFLNRLNSAYSDSVKIFNIIGLGCESNGEDGDGVVLKSSAELNNSFEYYINGSCSGLNFLHNDLVKPSKYPQIMEILRGILVS